MKGDKDEGRRAELDALAGPDEPGRWHEKGLMQAQYHLDIAMVTIENFNQLTRILMRCGRLQSRNSSSAYPPRGFLPESRIMGQVIRLVNADEREATLAMISLIQCLDKN